MTLGNLLLLINSYVILNMKWLLIFIPVFTFGQKEFNFEKLSKAKLKKEYFDSSFYNHKGFLLGDVHGIKESYEILFMTIKHLYNYQGVKNVFLERGKDYLYFANGYINNEISKEQFLNSVDVRNSLLETKEEFKFYKRIKQFNSKKEDSLKVKLKPMFEFSLPITALNFLFRNIDHTKRDQFYLGKKVDSLRKLTAFDKKYFMEQINLLEKEGGPVSFFASSKSDKEEILTVNPDFENEYHRLKKYILRLDSASLYMQYRENELANAVSNYVSSNSSPFIVFIGRDHVMKSRASSVKYLDSLFHQKVTSRYKLASDYFCFISPITLKGSDLYPCSYDKNSHKVNWCVQRLRTGGSIIYNYRINKAFYPKSKYSWFIGNQQAQDYAITLTKPYEKWQDATDYLIVIKKPKALKPFK